MTTTETSAKTPFEIFLNEHDEEAWAATITTLMRSIHDVDKNATQIWFSFFPLSLFHAFEQADDPVLLAQQLLMRGNHRLRDQVDTSHTFLYGHRYWPEVKSAVAKHAESFGRPGTAPLSDQILAIAQEIARKSKVD